MWCMSCAVNCKLFSPVQRVLQQQDRKMQLLYSSCSSADVQSSVGLSAALRLELRCCGRGEEFSQDASYSLG